MIKVEVTPEELKIVTHKLISVKQTGFGELIIKVQDGRIVYITTSIGEQVKI